MVNIFQADERRFDFLKKELDGLKAAQAKSKEAVTEYIKGLLDRYFEQFPRDLTIDPTGKSRIRIGRKAREGKIRRWLNNHTTKGRVMDGELVYIGPAEPDSSTEDELGLEGEGTDALSKGKGKETRVIVSKERVMSKVDRNTLLQAMVEGSITDEKNYTTPANLAFMSMYWVDIKDEIHANHKAYLANASLDPGKKKSLLTFQGDESRRLLEESTPRVKDLVEKYRRQGTNVLRKMDGETDEEYEHRLEEDKAARLKESIRNIGGLVEDFMLAVKEVTGYVGIAYVGGENPDKEGAIVCRYINSGETKTHGSTFTNFIRGRPLQIAGSVSGQDDLIKEYFARWVSLATLPQEPSQINAVASSSKTSVATKQEEGALITMSTRVSKGARNRTPPVTVRNPPSIIGDPDIEFLGEVSPGTVLRDRKKMKASLARGLKANPIVIDDEDDVALGKRDGKVAEVVDVVDGVLEEEERGRSLQSRRALRQIVPSVSPPAEDRNATAREKVGPAAEEAIPASSSSAIANDTQRHHISPITTALSTNAAITAEVEPVSSSAPLIDTQQSRLSPSSVLSSTTTAAPTISASSAISNDLVAQSPASTLASVKDNLETAVTQSNAERQLTGVTIDGAITQFDGTEESINRQTGNAASNEVDSSASTKDADSGKVSEVSVRTDTAAEETNNTSTVTKANDIANIVVSAESETNARIGLVDMPTALAASDTTGTAESTASETNAGIEATTINAASNNAPDSKSRTATDAKTLELESEISNLPQHLRKPAECLLNVFEDDHTTMVFKWLISEKLLGFQENKTGRLRGNRPNEIGVWSRGFRTYNPKKFPAIMDIEEFDKVMYSWWDAVAPGGQVRQNSVSVIVPRQSVTMEKWEQLRVGGHNGLQTVLFGLAFWKTHNGSPGAIAESLERYRKLCEDIEFVLGDFIAKLKEDEKRRKRDLEEAEGAEQSNAKKVKSSNEGDLFDVSP